jgi:hypothetical protein
MMEVVEDVTYGQFAWYEPLLMVVELFLVDD